MSETTEDQRRAFLEQYWAGIGARDFDTLAGMLSDDFVEDWPQSGERIRGAGNWVGMAREHPAFPSVKHVRTAGSGDVWVSEVIFDYGTGDPPWRVCSIIEFSGDRIGRVTEYFGQPFEAPAWRAPFTERIPEGG